MLPKMVRDDERSEISDRCFADADAVEDLKQRSAWHSLLALPLPQGRQGMGQGTQRDEAPEALCQRAMQGYPQEQAAEVLCGAEVMRNGASSSPGGDSPQDAPETGGEVGGSSPSSGSRAARGPPQPQAAQHVNPLDTNLHYFHQFAPPFSPLPNREEDVKKIQDDGKCFMNFMVYHDSLDPRWRAHLSRQADSER
eukprot:Skav228386  [mRNA]  locus=scaffold1981:392023:398301:+ [translate_table: standard]